MICHYRIRMEEIRQGILFKKSLALYNNGIVVAKGALRHSPKRKFTLKYQNN
jgi:hypothetical protein